MRQLPLAAPLSPALAVRGVPGLMTGSAAGPLAVALLLSALPAAAGAWSGAGHQVVAAVAEARLGPEARALVREIAGGEPISSHDLATWADRHRTEADQAWHYVNLPLGGAYLAARDCPAGGCAVAAIERALATLRRERALAARLDALRWLVHLVGDLHQPLHAGSALDRGGNQQRVRLGRRREPTNLHAVWDDEVVERLAAGRRPRALAQALLAASPPGALEACATSLEPAGWAGESSRAAQAIYQRLGVTPQGHGVAPRSQRLPVVEDALLDAWADEAGRALRCAGVRLAALLDEVARGRVP